MLLALLGKYNKIKQTVYALDTFCGTPSPTKYDFSRFGGEFKLPTGQPGVIRTHAEELGISERVEILTGLFRDTLPVLPQHLVFSFVHVDCNMYDGTNEACQYAIPRLLPGGIAVFDDYNGVCDLGARLAIERYFRGVSSRPRDLVWSSAYVVAAAEDH